MNSALATLREWGLRTFESSPFLIAGPSSAEDREQVLATARAIRKLPISLFRAGIWKPRTLSESFAGAGNIALSWLEEVRGETGLPVAIELDHPSHLEEAVKADIDVFWLGARTTVNPFAVEELARAFEGIDKPIFVKNPIIPDLGVWIDVIERLQNHGIRKIGVIMRGVVNRHPSKWRYEPEWDLVQKFRQRFPELPCLCDPSHIAGDVKMIFDVCQDALNLNLHGLMIETHYNPGKALNDAEQQLSPEELEELLDRLVLKFRENSGHAGRNVLNQLRQKIDNLDQRFVALLAARLEATRQIGKIKKELNMPALQPERWKEVLQGIRTMGQKQGVSLDFLEALYELIHQESLKSEE